MFRKWFIVAISILLANLISYQFLAFIQWNWEFSTWSWVARMVLVFTILGSFNFLVKQLKGEQ
jgi:hypothetical protein